MTRIAYISKLTEELKRLKVADAADIIDEYEQHFAFKIADGHSEEEIAAALGDPCELAGQFVVSGSESRRSGSFLTRIGIAIADFGVGLLSILMFAFLLVMIAAAIAFSAAGVCLIAKINTFGLIPQMPYLSAVLFGIMFAALSVLTITGCIYYKCFVCQMIKSYGRFRRNSLSSIRGGAVLPSLPVNPQFSGGRKRCLRRVALTALMVFAVMFVCTMVLSMISAGNIQFWHEWKWFGYGN